MTILYEPVCRGAEHAPFNAALLATTLEAYPRRAVMFLAEPEHLGEVRALLDRTTANAIVWQPLDIAPRDCRAFRARLPYEWRVVAEVLGVAARVRGMRVIACAVTHAGLAALEGQLLTRAWTTSVAVVHHSGLSATLGSRSTRALLRWTAGGRIRHVVLARSILRTATDAMPGARGIASIRHPYLFPPVDLARSAWPAGEPPRFGFLGLASEDKGFDRFCRVAAAASQALPENAVRPRFELVGRLDSASRDALATLDPGGHVEIGSRNGPMARSLYEARADALAYAILPYAPTHDLASSGAILDAFGRATPCIALRTPLFEEYFSLMGDIGYLCADERELTAVVRDIVRCRPLERYAAQRRAIVERRVLFTPRYVARELRQVLS